MNTAIGYTSPPPGMDSSRAESIRAKAPSLDFETAFAEYFVNGFPPEMAELRELTYREVTQRLRKLGFRFYRQGRDHMNFGCVTQMAVSCLYPIIVEKGFGKERSELLSVRLG